MKFLVDSTAGALCRWLRILGHDARYVSGAAAGEMLSMARREGRILLSRLDFVPKESARNRVPPYVFQTQEAFGYCATCDRFYWKATHWEAMRARLGSIFGPGFPEEDVLGEGGHDGE